MAIVISDTNDKRKKVDLNLGKVSLTPTIAPSRGSPTVVQDTSAIVKQGDDFLRAFSNIPKMYGQAVEVFTEEGKREAAELTQDDFNTALENVSGDGFSLFGKTKAFNEGLVERYFATEVPLALQKIDQELTDTLTTYGTPEKFEAAAAQKVGDYFNEVRGTFDDNVFSNRALNAYTSLTTQKYLLKANEKYSVGIQDFNNEEAANKAYRGVADLGTSDIEYVNPETGKSGLLATAELVYNKNFSTIKDKGLVNKQITGAIIGDIDSAIKNKDFVRAEALLDEAEDEDFKLNGLQIFNTAEAGNKLKTARALFEQAEEKHRKETIVFEQAESTAVATNEVASLIRTQNEEVGLERANTMLDDIANGSIELDGKTYTDPQVLQALRTEITAAKFNPKIFSQLHDENIINTATSDLNVYQNNLTNTQSLKGAIDKLGLNQELFFPTEDVDGGSRTESRGTSPFLSEALNKLEIYKDELIRDIYNNMPADLLTNQQVGYIKKEIQTQEIQGKMQSKLEELLQNNVPSTASNDNKLATLKDELKALNVNDNTITYTLANSENPIAELTELKRVKEAGATDNYYLQNGKVQTKGFFYSTMLNSFNEATANEAWLDSSNKLDNHDKLVKKAIDDAGNLGKDILLTNGDLNDKITGYISIAEYAKVHGIKSDDVLNGYENNLPVSALEGLPYNYERMIPENIAYRSYTLENTKVTIKNLMNGVTDFNLSSFGIRLGKKKGSFKTTIEAINTFEKDFTVDPVMQQIADKFGVNISELYAQQRAYFETNGYLETK